MGKESGNRGAMVSTNVHAVHRSMRQELVVYANEGGEKCKYEWAALRIPRWLAENSGKTALD